MTIPEQTKPVTVQFVTVDDVFAGQRIDNFLLRHLKGVPKSRIYRILRKGEVRVNKARVKPDYRIEPGDLVRIPPIRQAATKPSVIVSQTLQAHLANAVVFEDERLMVINKPTGLAVHGGDGVNLGLIEALRQVRSDCRYLELVHRLDRDTSGCVMVAKKRSELRYLQDLLRHSGSIDKTYQALVIGAWPDSLTRIDQPLLRTESADGNRVVKVASDGKASATVFKLLKRFNVPQVGALSLISAKPLTGRTHQIRVHAQFAGHSLVGDEKYGNDAINARLRKLAPLNLCLHAESLRIPRADGAEIWVQAPLREELIQLIEQLG
jgi:23S rRNA pseudouridine955/2504/2580 synthase